VQEATERKRFEDAVMPHVDAAYNLARWLTGDKHDAEDVVQESYLRALKYFQGFHGSDGRTWLLKIVRHTGYTWLHKHRRMAATTSFDEELHGEASESENPEKVYLQRADRQMLHQGLESLVVEFREVLVLRELEGLSYHEIATVTGIPLGTVMSRLARARSKLQQALARCQGEEG
jgi:RNA polymerase sigma factor (sigma-70 family)